MAASHSAAGLKVEVAVIGSGFGGAAVACRLSQVGKKVAVLELGQDYSNRRPEVMAIGHGTDTIRHGHFVIDRHIGMNVARGIGVGGGSLHYFGVRIRTPPDIFQNGRWPASIYREMLDPYYDLAGLMLQASPIQPNPVLGTTPVRSNAFIKAAQNCVRCQDRNQTDDKFYVDIAVHSSKDPKQTDSGIDQTRCVYCGECVIGCPPSESFNGDVNARALLTLNYLAVARKSAKKLGIDDLIYPLNRVNFIRKANESGPIAKEGYKFEVHFTAIDPAHAGENEIEQDVGEDGILYAKKVVVAAGTMGSTEILLRSRSDGLPIQSAMLGKHFSGNGDFLIAKTINTPQNLQPKAGPTITVGADFSPMVNGKKVNSIFIEDLGLIPFVEAMAGLRPLTATTTATNVLGYLGMGTDAGNGTMSLRPTDGRLVLNWDPAESLPLYLQLQACLLEMSQQLSGDYADPDPPFNPISGEGLLTAHPLGGCVLTADGKANTGVVDPEGQVYGVPGLYVADGSIIPGALGINPSYTISALAERIAFRMLVDYTRELSAAEANVLAADYAKVLTPPGKQSKSKRKGS